MRSIIRPPFSRGKVIYETLEFVACQWSSYRILQIFIFRSLKSNVSFINIVIENILSSKIIWYLIFVWENSHLKAMSGSKLFHWIIFCIHDARNPMLEKIIGWTYSHFGVFLTNIFLRLLEVSQIQRKQAKNSAERWLFRLCWPAETLRE